MKNYYPFLKISERVRWDAELKIQMNLQMEVMQPGYVLGDLAAPVVRDGRELSRRRH